MKVEAFHYGVFALTLLGALLMVKDKLNSGMDIIVLVIYSVIGAIAAFDITPHVGEKCISKGLYGLDINKGTQDKVFVVYYDKEL